MDIRNELENLCAYYASTRGVGHTDLIKKGTDLYDKENKHYNVICSNIDLAKREWGHKGKSLNHVGVSIKGTDAPLVFDNSAIVILLQEAINKIDELEKEVKRLQGNVAYRMSREYSSWDESYFKGYPEMGDL